MTHFAAADDPDHDDFTRRQVESFDRAVRDLARAGHRPRWVHACNSAAVVRFPGAHHTMVRSGLGLLGYGGVPGTAPVLRLVTRVVSVKDLPHGHPVGYGLAWRADGSRRIAVVALGYNDGYPWALSNRGWMSVRGRRCPVVGRVCMDVTMLDVTGAPEVASGDEVVVFGPGADEPDLLDLSRAAGTIPYEILTRLSGRLRRIFRSSL
jgi:alanine racemase